MVDNVALGQVFFEYFGFPCHRLLHSYHLSFVAGTIGQIVSDAASGLSFTPLQEIKNKLSIFLEGVSKTMKNI
jgi:hypothetical protein